MSICLTLTHHWQNVELESRNAKFNQENLHLQFTNEKQLVENFCYSIDEFHVLRSEFLVTPFFKIFCYLADKEDTMTFRNGFSSMDQILISSIFFFSRFYQIYERNDSIDTLGMRTGFFAAYSHNLTIFLSLGGPS